MSKKKTNKNPLVGFISLGCPKNTVDSEKMLADIAQAGWVITGRTEDVDILVINTCGFIEPACREAFEVIEEACEAKKAGKCGRIVVTGCLAQRMGAELKERFPLIDAVAGLAGRDEIVRIIDESVRQGQKDIAGTLVPVSAPPNDDVRLLITPGHYAYLRISEGCSRACAFCTIPAIRGRFRSKPLDAVISEAERLVSSGCGELIIIAQDSSYYGTDLGGDVSLISIINALEGLDGLKWLRIMYMYPSNISDELIGAVAESEKCVNYIDMPIQHISDSILKAMNRADTKEKTTALVEKLRRAMPDAVLRTTVITGFPGETDRESEELLDFIKRMRFDALGCFPFYPERGTKAAAMPGQVPDDVKRQRQQELMLTQQEIVFEKNAGAAGKELECVVDEIFNENTAAGRFYGQAPDIDGRCIIPQCPDEPGSFIKCRVIDYQDYDLICEPV